jgi:starch synthase
MEKGAAVAVRIVFFSSEVAPFSKTGGLADVAGSLPAALAALGHDVRVITPCYPSASRCGMTLHRTRIRAGATMGDGKRVTGTVRTAELNGVTHYLLGNRHYFGRSGLYGTPEGDYPDNAQRFAFLCRAGLELLKSVDFAPDVIHCHDWQTALVPYLLRHPLAGDPFFARAATFYTIHNLAYQGLFPPGVLPDLGLDDRHFTIERLEFYGRISLMKGGIGAADAVTTVSPEYCREILTSDYGCGLEGVLGQRSDHLYGILNGLDYALWNPATDRTIAATYSARAVSGKRRNKGHLRKLLGLPASDDLPILAMVTRMASQKGLDLLEELLPWLAGGQAQLVLLGTGEARYLKSLGAWERRKIPGFSFNLRFDNDLAAHIYAGSDIFLMPSQYEPCGLGQLIALRYGTIPVVHRTGGLADTVVDPHANPATANGFCFDDYTPASFRDAIERAIAAYRSPDQWLRLVRNAMTADHSWDSSARRYAELYRHYIGAKRSGNGT